MDDLCGNCRTTCKKCMQTRINAEKERERHRMNRRIELLVFPHSLLLRTDWYSRSSPPFCYTCSAESTNSSARNSPIVRAESVNCPRGLPRNTAQINAESPRGSLQKKLSTVYYDIAQVDSPDAPSEPPVPTPGLVNVGWGSLVVEVSVFALVNVPTQANTCNRHRHRI